MIADKKLAVPGGFDEAGNLSNDPKKITKTGRVLPMGFWKGSSLSILMDMMVSSISGGNCVSYIKNQGNTPETETNLSQIFIALKVDDKTISDDTISRIVAEIKNCRPSNNGGEVRYPSENLLKIREKSLKDGIEITDDEYNKICNL